MALHSKTHITKIKLHNHRSKCSQCNQHKYSLWRDVQSTSQMNIGTEIWSLQTRDTAKHSVRVNLINHFVILGRVKNIWNIWRQSEYPNDSK